MKWQNQPFYDVIIIITSIQIVYLYSDIILIFLIYYISQIFKLFYE